MHLQHSLATVTLKVTLGSLSKLHEDIVHVGLLYRSIDLRTRAGCVESNTAQYIYILALYGMRK